MKRHLIRYSAVITLAAATLCPVALSAQSVPFHAGPAPQIDNEPLDQKVEILNLNGTTWKVEDLVFAASLRNSMDFSYSPMNDVPRLRGEQLADFAHEIGAWEFTAEQARELGIELNEDEEAQVKRAVSSTADRRLYREQVVDKMGEPTDDDLQEIYQEQKETTFKLPEEWRMRHIFVSTYAPYTVKAGDTLESIAKDVAGDVGFADKIISEETKQPRIEMTEGENEEGETKSLPPRALQEGEQLLVPATGEKVNEAKAKIDAALAALEEGRDFEEVAKEYSENQNPGRLWVIQPQKQEREIIPELQETFLSLEDGSYSEPLRTKHGFQIVYRERFQEAGYVTFEEAKPFLARKWQEGRSAELTMNFFEGIENRFDFLKINEDQFRKTGTDAKPNDVMATINGEDFVRSSIKPATLEKIDSGTTADEIEDLIIAEPIARQGLLTSYFDSDEYQKNKDYQITRSIAYNTRYSNKWFEQLAAEAVDAMGDEELMAYYEANKDKYTQKEAFDLYRFIVPIEEGESEDAAKQRIAEKLAGVDKLEEFQYIVTQNSSGSRARSGGALGMVPSERLPEEQVELLKTIERPGMTPPQIESGQVSVLWVHDMRPEKIFTLEERREDVKEALRTEKLSEIRDAKVDEYEEQVTVEVLAAAQDE